MPDFDRENISTLIRELADDMKAIRDANIPDRMAAVTTAGSTAGAVAYTEKLLAELSAKYRDKPLPKLSDELRAKLGAGIPEIEG